jgi:hypothetical protein
MSQHEQLDVLSELTAAAPDQEPQHSREGEIGERKEHQAMLPSPGIEGSKAETRSSVPSCEGQRELVRARA